MKGGLSVKKHFVHRDKYSHYKKRVKFKKLLKSGNVRLVERRKDGWLYEELNKQPVGYKL